MYDKNTTNKLQKENIMNNDDIFNEWVLISKKSNRAYTI